VLLMSVYAGFGGQEFIPETLDKIRVVKQQIQNRNLDTLIEVDGGIHTGNASSVFEAGADILVAGSAVFHAPDPIATIHQMKQ